MVKITLEFSGKSIETFTLDKPEILIGRNGANDIVIDNLAVSDRHARIVKENDQYVLEDLDSTNGTWSGVRKVKRMALGAGEDAVRIGKHLLRIRTTDGRAASPDFQKTIKIDPGRR
ncbi:MAG: FHA domain-containing protein [Desulfobacterales bacterium]